MQWTMLYAPDLPRDYTGIGKDFSDVVYENGILKKVNLIIATGQNNLAMNRTVAQHSGHKPAGRPTILPQPEQTGGYTSCIRPSPTDW